MRRAHASSGRSQRRLSALRRSANATSACGVHGARRCARASSSARRRYPRPGRPAERPECVVLAGQAAAALEPVSARWRCRPRDGRRAQPMANGSWSSASAFAPGAALPVEPRPARARRADVRLRRSPRRAPVTPWRGASALRRDAALAPRSPDRWPLRSLLDAGVCDEAVVGDARVTDRLSRQVTHPAAGGQGDARCVRGATRRDAARAARSPARDWRRLRAWPRAPPSRGSSGRARPCAGARRSASPRCTRPRAGTPAPGRATACAAARGARARRRSTSGGW